MENSAIIINKNPKHDTSVALILEGKIESIIETERVTKNKHAIYQNPEAAVKYLKDCYNLPEDIKIVDGSESFLIKYKKHHELHALGSILSSGFDDCVCLVVDGSGDLNDSVTIFRYKNDTLFEVKKYSTNTSLGFLYELGSYVLYKQPFMEGKLMGLSSNSFPDKSVPSPIQYSEKGEEILLVDPSKYDNLGQAIYHYCLDNLSNLFDSKGNILEDNVYKARFASTIQYWYTEQILNLVKYIKNLFPKQENLCLCGGCFLNCETNGMIDRLQLFKNIYCPPAPADNSIILGIAQQYLKEVFNKTQKIETSYFGPKQNNFREFLNDIKKEDKFPIEIKNIYDYKKDLLVEFLKKDYVIAWFDSFSEFGPRALGHRSFLASPTNKDNFKKISVGIKQREFYRPLAPIILDKYYPDVFEDPNPENLSQFMLKTVEVKKEWRSKIPAVVHTNNTARPQYLKREVNSELYELLEEYYSQTGIPCLINTSLNLKGTPIVETYEDLIQLILRLNAQSNILVVVNHDVILELRGFEI